jgi:hypothetical protein
MKIDSRLEIESPLDHPEARRIKDCALTVMNGYSFGAMIISDGGLGKTRGIRKMLEEYGKEGEDWVHIQSNVTDTRLYISLYEHNRKIIFFDDLGDAAKTKAGITILKQATETIDGTTRYVSWNSPSVTLADAPPVFKFTGKIIFCLNQLSDENNPDIQALKTRFRSCVFNPSNRTVLEMMSPVYRTIGNDIGLNDDQCDEIYNYICDITTEDSFNINIRLLLSAYSLFRVTPHRWKQYIAEDTGLGKEDRIIMEINNRLKLRGDAAYKIWKSQTGKSKSTYHIKLNKLRGLHMI